ncbi:MAG: hypothetical protein AAGA54_05525 [Myxococcota bacterium]
MRHALLVAFVLPFLGCAGRNTPSKGFVAREMNCKRGGVKLSETFEDTWTDDDGVMHVRYRVGASCSKPKSDGSDGLDVWRVCRWTDDRYKCEDWQAGKAGGASSGTKSAPAWLDGTQRGRP